jgi:hypothetical protein
MTNGRRLRGWVTVNSTERPRAWLSKMATLTTCEPHSSVAMGVSPSPFGGGGAIVAPGATGAGDGDVSTGGADDGTWWPIVAVKLSGAEPFGLGSIGG